MIPNSEAWLLLSSKPGRRIVVNNSIACVFASSGEFAFGPFAKDDASPSHTATADVHVIAGRDIEARTEGKMYLTCHNDMDNTYSCIVIRNGIMTDVTNVKPEV